jgi:hypothetical protein
MTGFNTSYDLSVFKTIGDFATCRRVGNVDCFVHRHKADGLGMAAVFAIISVCRSQSFSHLQVFFNDQ